MMKRALLLGLYGICLAAFIGYFAVATTGRGAATPWVVYGCVVLACLAAAPRHAILGPLVYVALAYGLSSHAPELDILLETRALDGVALFSLAGWWLAGSPRQTLDQSTAKPMVLAALLFGWILLCAGVALGRGATWGSFLRHDPSGFLQAGILFFVTANLAGSRQRSLLLAAGIVATVIARAMWQGIGGIHLESYVATLLVMGVPVSVLGAWIANGRATRAVFALAGVAMAVLLALTENRAAAVAAVAMVAAFAWQLRGPRWGRAMLALLVLVGLALAFVPSSYVQRFTALVDPQLAHPGAGLDRKTASERMQLWSAGWEMALDHPVTGVGPGNYPAQLGIYLARKPPMAAHSNYVQMLAETGFAGLALYGLFFLAVVRVSGLERLHREAPWRTPAGRMLQLALVAYLAGGAFNSRHDFVMAYLVAGWALAVCVPPRPPTPADTQMRLPQRAPA